MCEGGFCNFIHRKEPSPELDRELELGTKKWLRSRAETRRAQVGVQVRNQQGRGFKRASPSPPTDDSFDCFKAMSLFDRGTKLLTRLAACRNPVIVEEVFGVWIDDILPRLEGR
jgi:hypothetical protein